jgi:hypothetical protein
MAHPNTGNDTPGHTPAAVRLRPETPPPQGTYPSEKDEMARLSAKPDLSRTVDAQSYG